MKKKVLSYLLCTAMVFSMAACGDNAGNPSDSQGDSVENSGEVGGGDETPDDGEVGGGDETPDDGEVGGGDETPETPDEPEVVEVGPAFIKVEAEDSALMDGASVEGDHLGGLNKKAWAKYTVDLKDGNYGQVVVRYGADSAGGTVRLWIGDEDYAEFGTMAGEAEFAGTGSWDATEEIAIDVPELASQSGTIDIVLEWEGEEYLMNPDYFILYKAGAASDTTKSFSFYENEWGSGGYRGDEPNYTHIYATGGTWATYKVNLGDGGCGVIELTGCFNKDAADCEIEVRLGGPEGEVVGGGIVAARNGWNDDIIQTNVAYVGAEGLNEMTGIQSICLVFKSGDFNFAGFRFPRIVNEDTRNLFANNRKLEVNPDSAKSNLNGFNENESVASLFDTDKTNKFCGNTVAEDQFNENHTDEETGTVTIEISLTESATVSGYAFCTANDNASYPDRNPASWVLYGNDGGNWVQIDASSREVIGMVDENYTYFGRACAAGAAYQDYKLVITHNVEGAETFQISDFALFTAE